MSDTASGLVILVLAGYFIPAIIAAVRGHKNRMAITALNVLLGWTFVGWVAAFVWALTSNVAESGPSELRPWFKATLPNESAPDPLSQPQMPPRQKGESFGEYTARVKRMGLVN